MEIVLVVLELVGEVISFLRLGFEDVVQSFDLIT
jgi:hypothetical protein